MIRPDPPPDATGADVRRSVTPADLSNMPESRPARSPQDWPSAIIHYIEQHPDRPLKARALARELHLAGNDYADFRDLVRDMLDDGRLILGPGRTLALPTAAGRLTGTFKATRHGYGFVEVSGRDDLYVRRGDTGRALDGDTVQIRLVRGREGRPPTAEVLKIVERAPLTWVGVLERRGRTWVVQPRGRAALPMVQIDDPTAKGALPGDMVVVEPLEHTLDSALVRGVIVERLGDPTQTQTKILSVIRRANIRDLFPAEVRHAAHEALARFNPDDIGDREDLRELLTITIDPADARDFDDAISLTHLPGGKVELGVHIADVAHFVPAGGPLDAEARERGNSVYFPGYVVPMLPEVLSNGVCSLQPGQPRLTKSVFITYDRAGRVIATRLSNSVIRSRRRFTYDEVTDVLEGRGTELDPPLAKLLKDAESLAKRIRARRLVEGMLVLNLPELEIKLDAAGRPISSGPADSAFSHTLIEMFMVESNEAVSRFLRERGVDHLRRVHPQPPEDAQKALAQIEPLVGRRLPRHLDRGTIRELLDAFRGRPEEPAVHFVLLRSMAQAVYRPTDEGHFALASEDYAHFTSPIRRYADLTVHRLLDQALHPTAPGPRSPRRRRPDDDRDDLDVVGRHISATERRAQQAERDLKNLLVLELMKSRIGEEFDGLVTGVTSFGAFVQLRPDLAEGLIRIGDFGREDWEFDDQRLIIRSRQSRRVVCLGQSVRVLLAAVDEVRGEIALLPARGRSLGMVIESQQTKATRRPSERSGTFRPQRQRGRHR